jgi:proton-translocating NADH-quinone oxidoreductase chain M
MLSILNLIILPSFGIFLILSIKFFLESPISHLSKSPQHSILTESRHKYIEFFKVYNFDVLYKGIALYFASLNLIFSSYYYYYFEAKFFGFQFITEFNLFNTNIRFGIDGISFSFIFLTLLLIPICLLLSWEYIEKVAYIFLVCFLLLEIALIIFFTTLNILVLYISFESTLIPMFIIIGIWGGLRKIKASYYFFMFTLLGSVFMLLGILLIWGQTHSLDLLTLLTFKFTHYSECLFWALFFIGFAVKIPIFPFHLWLPEAHVEAPTAGSVLLAGLLLKLGGYGFIRMCLTFFPQGTIFFSSFVALFCILSVLFASFAAVVQVDLKKLVAYSSIAHMNFGLLGLFTDTKVGVDGCILSMLSHGFISSALFISVDVIYRRYGTRLIEYYSGLALVMPKFSFFLGFFCFSNIGFPGTSSFIGEILTFIALPFWNGFVAVLAGTTVIWSSVYSLLLFTKVSFGNYKPFGKLHVVFFDLINMEVFILGVLGILSLILGIYPELIMCKLDYATTFLVEYNKHKLI